MKTETYSEIIRFIHESKPCINVQEVAKHFPGISRNTLGSICSLEHQKRMKKIHFLHSDPISMERYYQRYCMMVKDGRNDIFKTIAEDVDISPAHIGRLVLEKFVSLNNLGNKTVVSNMIKDTSLIPDPFLAKEIDLAIVTDEYYGPVVDSIKHSIGQEYEHILQQKVESLGLAYVDENDLRTKGYDKTPDIKLEVPIAVDGHVVNWIESKASFGDEESHQGYLKDQFWAYWNRFGPGLVIYWFGFLEVLDVNKDKGIMLMDHFPDTVTKMNPSCI